MNSPSLAPAARRTRPRVSTPAPGLAWIHDGLRYRVSVWPEVRFECELTPGEWHAVACGESACASAALGVGPAAWRRYLEFAPAGLRAFLELFGPGRMAALHVASCLPELLPDLTETPALTSFLALHRSLRGGDEPAWAEIAAVFERDGLFGVLQWLGLPASRQTLFILRQVEEPDLARRLIEPLRSALWEPHAIHALARAPILTDARLTATCHAMAA